jgi:quinol monooxygenase YgiN
MVVIKVSAEILPQKRQEFLQVIEAMIVKAPDHGAGFSRRIYEELGRQNIFCYLEEWTSREALETHLKTDRFQALIGAMEVLGQIQDFKIITSATIEGLETLNTV